MIGCQPCIGTSDHQAHAIPFRLTAPQPERQRWRRVAFAVYWYDMGQAIWEFIRAVGKWWWAVIVDWLFGFLSLLVFVHGHVAIPPAVSWGIIFFGFVLACFFAFRQILKEKYALEYERDEARSLVESRKPRLVGTVQQTIAGESPTDNTVMLLVYLTIKNTGEPSIVESYRIQIKSGSETIEGQLAWIPENLQLFDDGPQSKPARVISDADAIYQKTQVPIPSGGATSGYLMASFSGLKRDQVIASTVVVTFKDVRGNEYSVAPERRDDGVPLSQAQRYAGQRLQG